MDEARNSDKNHSGDFPVSALAAVTDEASADLRQSAWFLGGLFDSIRDDESLLRCAHDVLTRARDADSPTLFWVISAFRDHLLRMDGRLRQTWLDSWAELRTRPDHSSRTLIATWRSFKPSRRSRIRFRHRVLGETGRATRLARSAWA